MQNPKFHIYLTFHIDRHAVTFMDSSQQCHRRVHDFTLSNLGSGQDHSTKAYNNYLKAQKVHVCYPLGDEVPYFDGALWNEYRLRLAHDKGRIKGVPILKDALGKKKTYRY